MVKKGININIQKKDLWLLSAIIVFLIGVGYVIAYNPSGTGGTPSIMGHSADEIYLPALLNSNGYITLPSGLILQWGSATSTVDDSQWFNFNIPFPNQAFQVQITRRQASSSYNLPCVQVTTTQFRVDRHDDIEDSQLFYWFAIGY